VCTVCLCDASAHCADEIVGTLGEGTFGKVVECIDHHRWVSHTHTHTHSLTHSHTHTHTHTHSHTLTHTHSLTLTHSLTHTHTHSHTHTLTHSVCVCVCYRGGSHIALKIIKNMAKYKEAARLEINVLEKINQKDPENKKWVSELLVFGSWSNTVSFAHTDCLVVMLVSWVCTCSNDRVYLNVTFWVIYIWCLFLNASFFSIEVHEGYTV